MKIEERKHTTKKGLAAVRELLDSLEIGISEDILVYSENFHAVEKYDDGYKGTDRAYLKLERGEIIFMAFNSDYGEDSAEKTYCSYFSRFDFPGFMIVLEDFIAKINKIGKEKDSNIKKFLELCEEYK